MKKGCRVGLIAVLAFFYLILGWNIGKIKYDMWNGENGYSSLKNLEKPKNKDELVTRQFLFPLSSFDALHNQHADGSASSKNRLTPTVSSVGPEDKHIYLLIQAIFSPLWTLVWVIFTKLFVINILFEIFVPLVGGIFLLFKLLFLMLLNPFV